VRKYHDIENITFEGDFLILTIDGKEKKFQLDKISNLLSRATDRERHAFEVSPSGYGIYWRLLDEDISIDGLLGISHAPERQRKSA
jgi:hypothetical protein